MSNILFIVCALSLIGAGAALVIAARHAVHLEKCRGAGCKTEARP